MLPDRRQAVATAVASSGKLFAGYLRSKAFRAVDP
jgi:hypothetical protein